MGNERITAGKNGIGWDKGRECGTCPDVQGGSGKEMVSRRKVYGRRTVLALVNRMRIEKCCLTTATSKG